MTEPAKHASHDFEAEMRSIHTQFAEMSNRCSDQLHAALAAFWAASAEGAANVEAHDQQVDEDEKTLDEFVLRVLALRHPVASDLRTLTACFKLVTDLERVSDQAVGIAKATAAGAPPPEMKLGRLRQMAAATEKIFSAATKSFLDKDEALAQQVVQADAAIGTLYRDVIADITVFASEHGEAAAKSLSAMNVARCLERIADHSANIAEGTRFALHDEGMPR